MRFWIAAALALIAAPSLRAEDLGVATPVPGTWRYAPMPGGSEATFANATATPQLWLHCTRATRRVSLSKAATAAAPFLNVWTSSQTRSAASAYNPATGRLTIELAAYDPLLDAMASSRGRFAVSVAGQAPLVVPPWPEVARVIEDCRA